MTARPGRHRQVTIALHHRIVRVCGVTRRGEFMMTAVDWAGLAVPLLAVLIGLLVLYRNFAAIDDWVRMLDALFDGLSPRPSAATSSATCDCNVGGAEL